MSSSGRALFFLLSPQVWHWWIIWYSPLAEIILMGFIKPLQFSARSPGLISTCLLHRQCGQWLVKPLPITSCPHCSQTKSSILRLKFWVIFGAECGNWTRALCLGSTCSATKLIPLVLPDFNNKKLKIKHLPPRFGGRCGRRWRGLFLNQINDLLALFDNWKIIANFLLNPASGF